MRFDRSPLSRRSYLAMAGGSLIGVSGCASSSNGRYDERSDPGTETTSEEPGESSRGSGTGAVELPPAIANNCVGFLTHRPTAVHDIPLVGGAWARPHPGPFVWGQVEPEPGTYDFSRTDAVVESTGERGVAVLPTLFPFAEWDQGDDPDCAVSDRDIFRSDIPSHRCVPTDLDAYKTVLRALVERYNGLGDRAMPGLDIPVRYWEVLNEPSMQSSELTFFNGTPDEYVELLRESYETIKDVCPECKVLNGGAAHVEGEALEFWEEVLAAGGGQYFDVANVHFIGRGDAATLNVAPFARLLENHDLDKPIWVTEVQFRNEDAPVVDMTRGAFDAGAEKVFYVNFAVGGVEPTRPGEYDPRYEQAVDLCDG